MKAKRAAIKGLEPENKTWCIATVALLLAAFCPAEKIEYHPPGMAAISAIAKRKVHCLKIFKTPAIKQTMLAPRTAYDHRFASLTKILNNTFDSLWFLYIG